MVTNKVKNRKLNNEEEPEKRRAHVSRRRFLTGAAAGLVVGAAVTYGVPLLLRPPKVASDEGVGVTVSSQDLEELRQTVLEIEEAYYKHKADKYASFFEEGGTLAISGSEIVKGHKAIIDLVRASSC